MTLGLRELTFHQGHPHVNISVQLTIALNACLRYEVSEQETVLRRSEKYTEEAVFPQRVAWSPSTRGEGL